MKKKALILVFSLLILTATPSKAFAPLLYWVGVSSLAHISALVGYYFLFTNTSNQSDLVQVTLVDTSTGEVDLNNIETFDLAAAASFKSTISSGGTYQSAGGAVASSNYAEEYIEDSVNSELYSSGGNAVYTSSAQVPDPVYVSVTSGIVHYYWAEQSVVPYYQGKVDYLFVLARYPQGTNYDSGAILAYIESVNSTTGLVTFREVGTVSAGSVYTFDDNIYTLGGSYTYKNYLTNQNVTVSYPTNYASVYFIGANGGIEEGSSIALTFGSTDSGTCSDGVQNGDETGVDTGGRCGTGGGTGNCSDGIQNGDETGVDTGGRCATGGSGACIDVNQDGIDDGSGIECTSVSVPGVDNNAYDTALDTPESLSWTGRVTSWMASNPLTQVVSNTHIELSGSECSFTASVFGLSDATIDFCSLSSSFTLFGVLFVGICVLRSFFIAFGVD